MSLDFQLFPVKVLSLWLGFIYILKLCISMDALMSFDNICKEYHHQMIILKSYNNLFTISIDS
jgi:hypothetical protein